MHLKGTLNNHDYHVPAGLDRSDEYLRVGIVKAHICSKLLTYAWAIPHMLREFSDLENKISM